MRLSDLKRLGYAVVEIEGIALEKLINTLSQTVRLYDVQRKGRKITLRVEDGDLKRLKALLPPDRCTCKVIRRWGLIREYELLKPRFMLFYGVLLALAVYIAGSCFIWRVQVETEDPALAEEIYRVAAEAGIKPLAPRFKVEGDTAENLLYRRLPQLAWVSVKHEGSRVHISAVEMTQPAEVVDRDKGVHLVATKDAVIRQVIVLQGQKRVVEGDKVTKGQLLISGIMEKSEEIFNGSDFAEPVITHAMGRVMGLTEYSVTVKVPLTRTVEEFTGRTATMGYLSLCGKRVPMGQETDFALFETTEEVKPLMGSWGLPVKYITVTAREKVQRSVTLSETEALREADRLGYEQIKELLPENGSIEAKETSYETVDGQLNFTYTLYVVEDIGEEQEIR